MINEKAKRELDDLGLSIRAVCSTLVSGFSVDDAISVMKRELAELETYKRNGQPSEMFERAATTMCTIRATCELCDREHFVSRGDFDTGELDELREKAKTYPDKYVEHSDYDMLDIGWMNGKQVVLGCECGELVAFERWIWSHRYTIAKYFKLKAEEAALDAKFAQECSDDVQAIANI